jgi:ubiquinone biosynthesis accessory factor UbiK
VAVRDAGHTPTTGAAIQAARIRPMIDRKLLDELGARVSQAVRDSPAADIEKNLRVLMTAFFDRFDLVARDDFEVQRKLLERAQIRLATLEARVAELEARKPSGR